MAIVMLIAAMCLAGSSVVVGKMLVATMPVFLAAFATLLVAFVCMLPLMYGRMGELRSLTFSQWRNLFLQGLCGIVLFRVLVFYGLHLTGAVQAGIITGSTPAVLALLSLLFLGESLTRRSLAGIACTVAGCIVINIFAGPDGGEGGPGNSLLGCLLVVGAVVSEALFTIFRKKIADSVSAVTNTTVLIFCSLLLLLLPALFDLRTMQSIPSRETLLAIVYYGVFATVCAYLLWTAAVGKVSGATAGATTAAMPASSCILAVWLIGEQIYWQHAVGCLLIVIGILVTTVGFSTGRKAVLPIQAANHSSR